MSVKIKTADNSGDHYLFGLIAGNPGLGKTTQATTFPQKKTLIISVEDGLLSIRGSNYAYVEINSYDELMDVLEGIDKIAPWAEYVYIDSLTEIYDVLKHELKGKYKPSQNFQKHDEMQDKMLHAIRTARKIKRHVFFTCHVKTDKDGMTMVQNLAFDGKLGILVLKQFDLSLHLDMVDNDEGKEERMFITSPELSKIAKRRLSPWIKESLEDFEEPNLYNVCQKLLGK